MITALTRTEWRAERIINKKSQPMYCLPEELMSVSQYILPPQYVARRIHVLKLEHIFKRLLVPTTTRGSAIAKRPLHLRLSKWIYLQFDICTALKYLPLQSTDTLKPGLWVTRDHWKWHHSIECNLWLPITLNNNYGSILHRSGDIWQCNMEIFVIVLVKSSKLVPFDSLPMVSY